MATQVLCAWCEAERRAVPSDELERLNHRSTLGATCWTHALTQLLRPRWADGRGDGSGRRGKLAEQSEALQRAVRLGEAHAVRGTERGHELEREITRLRGELDDFKIQRGQVVEAVQSWVGEMGRLTN